MLIVIEILRSHQICLDAVQMRCVLRCRGHQLSRTRVDVDSLLVCRYVYDVNAILNRRTKSNDVAIINWSSVLVCPLLSLRVVW